MVTGSTEAMVPSIKFNRKVSKRRFFNYLLWKSNLKGTILYVDILKSSILHMLRRYTLHIKFNQQASNSIKIN